MVQRKTQRRLEQHQGHDCNIRLRWYVYTVPAGVSSVNFILTTTAGANDNQKLTGNVTNVTSDVYYAVNGSSATETTERPDIVSEDVYVYFLNKTIMRRCIATSTMVPLPTPHGRAWR